MILEAGLRRFGININKGKSPAQQHSEAKEPLAPERWPRDLRDLWEKNGAIAKNLFQLIKSHLPGAQLTLVDEALITFQIASQLTLTRIELLFLPKEIAKCKDLVSGYSAPQMLSLALQGLESPDPIRARRYVVAAGDVAKCINDQYNKFGLPNETAIKTTVPAPIHMMQLAKED